MSLVGSPMALTHSLTHLILINSFIKVGLNSFLLSPLLSIVFVSRTSGQKKKLPRVNSVFHIANIAFQITVKTPATKQLKTDKHFNAVHFKFLDLS